MEVDFVKKMPVSVDAEQAVLGSVLIKPESFDTVAGKLKAEDFYLEEHQQIFSAMRDMFLQSRQIDPITLVNTLTATGRYDENTGIGYIRSLASVVPSAANIADYAQIVSDKATLRRLISTCDEISTTAYAAEGDVEHIVDAAEQMIFDIAQKRDTKEFRHIRDLMPEVYQNLERLSEKKRREGRRANRIFGSGPRACAAW